jgi:uncharacterized membrane protein (UPF0127 family)
MNALDRRRLRFVWPVLLLLLAGCGGSGEGPSEAGDKPPGGSAAAVSAAVDSTVARTDDRITIRVGGVPVRVRISQTPQEKERGLMFTERLPADEGMLFVFEYEHRLDFWMKNTPIDLDVAFIDRLGRIVEIGHMQALDEETIHRSRQPALYALEVNAGWFQEHGITVGDEVKF